MAGKRHFNPDARGADMTLPMSVDDDKRRCSPVLAHGRHVPVGAKRGKWIPLKLQSDGTVETSGGGGGGAELENAYWVSTTSLNVARPVPVEVFADLPAPPGTSLAGRSLTIWGDFGNCNIRFDSPTNAPLPVQTLAWPAMVTFVREFTKVYIDNPNNPANAYIKLYIGRRV